MDRYPINECIIILIYGTGIMRHITERVRSKVNSGKAIFERGKKGNHILTKRFKSSVPEPSEPCFFAGAGAEITTLFSAPTRLV